MKNMSDMRTWIEAIINSSDDAIISKDLNNIIVSWNKGAESLYGYKEQEVIGKPISIIIPEDKKNDIQMTADLIEEKVYIHHLETVRVAKDGRRIDVSVSVSPIMNEDGVLIGSSAIARDITERKKNEEYIRRSEDRYRKIVELSPETIIIHQDSNIVFVNEAGLKLFAATNKEDLIGKNIWTLYTPDRHGIIRAHNQSMKITGQPITNVEHTVIRLDGKIINVEASSCPIDYEGNPAIYIVLRDITERKKIKNYLDLQYKISQSLSETQNLIDGANEALKIICSNLNLDIGKVWLLKKEENVLDCITTWAGEDSNDHAINASNKQVTYEASESLPGKVWVSEEVCWVDLAADHEYKIAIGVPIFNGQNFIGVLEFMSAKLLNSDANILAALASITDQVGMFLQYKISENAIVFLGKHDVTTDLSNRAFFEETLTFELYRAKSKHKRLAVLLLDIDSFSDINEAIGHEFGDVILKDISKMLVELVDSNDNVARFSGDQFAVIMEDFHQVEEVTDFVNKVNSAVADKLIIKHPNINIKFNIGISLYPEDGDSTQAIMKSASIALSKAKQTGKGAIQFCTGDMKSRAKKRISIESDLRHAIDKQEFILFYQPVVDASLMEVSGFEALLRWSKEGNIIPPNDFISILEDSQLIVPVGAWVLSAACKQCKLWQKKLGRSLFISINISPVQFMRDDIYQTLSFALKDSGVDPSCVKIEITESAIMHDIQKTVKLLNKIKTLGVTIAIDDFGTGYSSLNYLRQLPIDYLKIDRSFIINMIDNQNDAAIVRTIINLAENLGYKTIAEGIETVDQLRFITRLGCNEIQGYYFARPMPASEAEEFLKQNKLII